MKPVTPVSPDALAAPALVCTSPVTDAAVMSPLKSVSDVTCEVAPALACAPLVAVTLVVTELAVTREPSAGYETAPSNAPASAGASSSRVPALGWPGMITLIAHALAIDPADRSAEPVDAVTPNAQTAAAAGITRERRQGPPIIGLLLWRAYLPSCSRA